MFYSNKLDFSSGDKAIIHLVFRLPTGEEEEERLVQDPTVASLLCAIYQLTNKSDKNCKLVFFHWFLLFGIVLKSHSNCFVVESGFQ